MCAKFQNIMGKDKQTTSKVSFFISKLFLDYLKSYSLLWYINISIMILLVARTTDKGIRFIIYPASD